MYSYCTQVNVLYFHIVYLRHIKFNLANENVL